MEDFIRKASYEQLGIIFTGTVFVIGMVFVAIREYLDWRRDYRPR